MEQVFEAVYSYPGGREVASNWAHKIVVEECRLEMLALAHKDVGMHFSARRATHESLVEFDIEAMAEVIAKTVPRLWRLFGVLLSADSEKIKRRQQQRKVKAGADSEDEYWQEDNMPHIPEDPEDSDSEHDIHEEDRQRQKILTLVTMISIAANSTNQLWNTFQTLNGGYMHACNTPESVIGYQSKIGLSISPSAINDLVTSLGREASYSIQKLGWTLLTSYAYDNFDVEIKHSVPTVDKAQETLLHLTSGTLILLEHGVTIDDLCCSKELWRKSKVNPVNFKMSKMIDWRKVLTLHPEGVHPSGLTHRERFNTWKFTHDLVMHGPEYFHQFRGKLGHPETIDTIPIVKSKQIPVRGMDINQSTVQGNCNALTDLFGQGGVGDPEVKKG
ncbi:hypothetical protein JAAARDRAFT_121422, partial [Jaapia argillacea MUCL 33604]